ncbi:MAG: DUF1573 domain-containing protein [Deltaproteobacteria bacterium]|nr:DUF1573 domain-containing protein [Deltaproteobacteria bacterium]MBW1929297.1 DUF1573 domain-containing protein [Deltaproteobacteria bacterium]MBW2024774.1 DUF1573 domain-containing protein [Deltaproteobacteria bacterium]MBW2124913.1 DUF1573 domain-containing protein [Deltaproteobacteria bacterium]
MKWIKVFIILFFWCLVIGATPSHGTEIVAPKAVFQEDSYDFKEVKEGITLIHEFHVLNAGTTPLKITKVSPG